MKYLKDFCVLIYDHWLIFVPTFGLGIVGYLKVKIPEIIFYKIQIWIPVCLFLVGLFVYYLYDKFLTDKRQVEPSMPSRPDAVIQKYEPALYMNVTWKVWMGTDNNFSNRQIWVDGPFCNKCEYELDRYEKSWFCVDCNKKYNIPSQLREYTLQKIIKIFTVKVERVGIMTPLAESGSTATEI